MLHSLKRESEDLKNKQAQIENRLKQSSSIQSQIPIWARGIEFSKEIGELKSDDSGRYNVTNYFDRFELVSSQAGWDDITKLKLLRLRIRGEAELFAQNHPELFDESCSWKATKLAFIERFTTKSNELTLLHSLLSIKLRPNETYRSFADRCKAAGRAATVACDSPAKQEGANEAMARVTFSVFTQCLDRELKSIIAASNESSIDKALDIIERISLTREAAKTFSSVPMHLGKESLDPGQVYRGSIDYTSDKGETKLPHEGIAEPTSNCNTLSIRNNPKSKIICTGCRNHSIQYPTRSASKRLICKNCGGSDHTFIRCPSTRCYGCGGSGHIRRLCPNSKEGIPNPYSANNSASPKE